MDVLKDLNIDGKLTIASVSTESSSMDALFRASSGDVTKRVLGTMALQATGSYYTSSASDARYLQSVTISLPTIFNVTTSVAIPSNPNLVATLVGQTANTVFAAPDGFNGTPSFRALVAGDIPAIAISGVTGLQTALDNKWTNGGDALSGTGLIGSTTNQNIQLIHNSIVGLTLRADGITSIKKLAVGRTTGFGGTAWDSLVVFGGNVTIGGRDSATQGSYDLNMVAHTTNDNANNATRKARLKFGYYDGVNFEDKFKRTIEYWRSGDVLVIGSHSTVINDAATTAPTEASSVYIGATGTVSIGVNATTYKLDVNGTGHFLSDVTFDANAVLSTAPTLGGHLTNKTYVDAKNWAISAITGLQAALDAKLSGSGSAGYIAKYTGSVVQGNSVMYETGGNIGISTTSPTSRLSLGTFWDTVNETVGINLREGSTSGVLPAYGIGFGPASTEGYVSYRSGTASTGVFGHKFIVNNSEKLRIRGDGRVGIGITTPQSLLDVNGDLTVASNIGVGGATAAGTTIRITKTMTGATDAYGILNLGTIQSDITNAYYYNSISSVASGSTLSTLFHYVANQGTISGSVTAQYGFVAASGLTGATNNFGFLGGINAGAGNRWNLYMNGTASNHINGSLGIGSTSLTGYTVRNTLNIGGAATSYGIAIEGQVQSTASTSARLFVTSLNTASGFTLPNAFHYFAGQGTLSGTVTSQSGFIASSTLSGAATNIGFQGNVVADTNNWNLYMSGTAKNYLEGSLWVGTSTSSYKLEVNGNSNFSYVAAPGSTGNVAYVAATGTMNYNSAFYNSGQVTGVKATAQLSGSGKSNQTQGIYAEAIYSGNDATTGGPNASLYGGRFVSSNSGTGYMGHIIGIKIDKATNNGLVDLAAGLYVQNQITAGTGTTTASSAIHIEGVGAGNAISFSGNTGASPNAKIYSSSANQLSIEASSGLFLNSGGGNVGIGTASPTHALTFPVSSSGIAIYNTSDQTTNYERTHFYWNGNIFRINTENGGTGNTRFLALGVSGTNQLLLENTSLSIGNAITSNLTSGGLVNINYTSVASSGTPALCAVVPTVNQTSTAGYRALWVSPYEQATGSGTKLLLDIGTNTAAKGTGTHTSKLTLDNLGNINFTGNIKFSGTNGLDHQFIKSNGTTNEWAYLNTGELQDKNDIVMLQDIAGERGFQMFSDSAKTYADAFVFTNSQAGIALGVHGYSRNETSNVVSEFGLQLDVDGYLYHLKLDGTRSRIATVDTVSGGGNYITDGGNVLSGLTMMNNSNQISKLKYNDNRSGFTQFSSEIYMGMPNFAFPNIYYGLNINAYNGADISIGVTGTSSTGRTGNIYINGDTYLNLVKFPTYGELSSFNGQDIVFTVTVQSTRILLTPKIA